MHLYRSGGRWSLTNPVLAYLVLAVLDVEGNYLVTLAYQYTSVTSVTLLDSATIPFVMVLSAIVFRWGRREWAGCQMGTTPLPMWRGLHWSCTFLEHRRTAEGVCGHRVTHQLSKLFLAAYTCP